MQVSYIHILKPLRFGMYSKPFWTDPK